MANESVVLNCNKIEQEYSDVLIGMPHTKINRVDVRDGYYNGENEVIIFFSNGLTFTIERCLIQNGVIVGIKDDDGTLLDSDHSPYIECNVNERYLYSFNSKAHDN